MSRFIFLVLALNLYASSVEVSVISPKATISTLIVDANGVVIAKNKTILTAKTTGLLQLLVSNNSFVKKGMKIAYIKDERREQNLQLLKQKLLLEKSQLKSQQEKLKDAKEKFTMGVGAKNTYLAQEIALKQLQETYTNTTTKYNLLKLEQKNSTIFAGENNNITNLLAQNSYISYGMPIATLLTKQTLVKLFVDAKYIHNIKKGMKIKIYSNYADTQGVITTILPKTSSNLVEVISTSKIPLPQDLQLSAKIILKNYKGIFIPKETIVLINNTPAVYVLKDGVVHQFFIDIKKDMIDKVLIKNNLPKDAKIVLKNAYMLHNNLEVSVK